MGVDATSAQDQDLRRIPRVFPVSPPTVRLCFRKMVNVAARIMWARLASCPFWRSRPPPRTGGWQQGVREEQ